MAKKKAKAAPKARKNKTAKVAPKKKAGMKKSFGALQQMLQIPHTDESYITFAKKSSPSVPGDQINLEVKVASVKKDTRGKPIDGSDLTSFTISFDSYTRNGVSYQVSSEDLVPDSEHPNNASKGILKYTLVPVNSSAKPSKKAACSMQMADGELVVTILVKKSIAL